MVPMDKVFIEGLEVEAVIGIHDWERRIRQALVLDVELGFDNRIPAESDSLDDTLDYEAIGNRLREYMAQSSCGLVERLAEQCANLLFLEFRVAEVRLKLRKLGALKGARSVGVEIVRMREQVGLAKPAAPAPAVVEPVEVEPVDVEQADVEQADVVESAVIEHAIAAPARVAAAMEMARLAPRAGGEPSRGSTPTRCLRRGRRRRDPADGKGDAGLGTAHHTGRGRSLRSTRPRCPGSTGRG